MTPQRLCEIKVRCDGLRWAVVCRERIVAIVLTERRAKHLAALGTLDSPSPYSVEQVDIPDIIAWAEKQMEWRDKAIELLRQIDETGLTVEEYGSGWPGPEIDALLSEAHEGATT